MVGSSLSVKGPISGVRDRLAPNSSLQCRFEIQAYTRVSASRGRHGSLASPPRRCRQPQDLFFRVKVSSSPRNKPSKGHSGPIGGRLPRGPRNSDYSVTSGRAGCSARAAAPEHLDGGRLPRAENIILSAVLSWWTSLLLVSGARDLTVFAAAL